MKSYLVYKAVSPSGKFYFGMTGKTLETRKREHLWLARSGKIRVFQKALVKYGESFKWYVEASGLSFQEAVDLEKSLIAQHNTTNREFGYNLSPGGMAGSIMSEEGKIRRKAKMAEHYKNPEYIKMLSDKKKLSLKNDPESSKKLSGYINAFFANPENKAKNAAMLKEIVNSREHREFMAKIKGGKPFMCNETGEIFKLLQDAADRFGVDKRRIHCVLKYPNRHKTILRKYTFKYVENKENNL